MSLRLSSRRPWFKIAVLATVLVSGAWLSTLTADQPEAADKPAASSDTSDDKQADPYAVPDGSAKELLAFIEKLGQQRPQGDTRKELFANVMKMQQAVVEAADKILSGKSTGEQAVAAINAKLRSLTMLSRFSDDRGKIAGQINKFIASLKDDKRPEVAAVVKFYQFQQRVAKLQEHAQKVMLQGAKLDEKLVETIAKELGDFLAGVKKLEQEHLSLVLGVASIIEQMGENKLAAGVFRSAGEVFSKSDDEQLAGYGEKFAGAARRLGLMGKPIKVFGTLLDGSEVKWDDYKGKVVLVDFWATWCGPCIQELPNVLENYERYHKRGFDVLAISLDGIRPGDREKVGKFIEDRKIPWKTLFNDKPGSGGWDHPMVNYYGIMGIPSVILVDKQGRVVSLNARGPALGELLAKHLGPIDEEGEKASSEDNK